MPARYKTLYYGLKMNHARNVAIVHPIMFTFRRLFYALSIVFLANSSFIGLLLFLVGTLIMLGYALHEL